MTCRRRTRRARSRDACRSARARGAGSRRGVVRGSTSTSAGAPLTVKATRSSHYRGPRQSALHQRLDEGAAIGGAGMEILGGSTSAAAAAAAAAKSRSRRRCGRSAPPRPRRADAGGRTRRSPRYGRCRRGRPRPRRNRQRCRRARNRRAGGEFLEAPAPLRRPRRQLSSVMISSAASAVVSGPRKKSAAAISRSPAAPTTVIVAVAGDRYPGHLGRRIGMGEAAADRAAIADLVMRDMCDRRPQQRMRVAQPPIVLDFAPAHLCAEPNPIFGDDDAVEARQFAQIDEQFRRGEAKRQQRHQALPAGDRLRLAAVRRQQRHRLGDRRRTRIIEAAPVSCPQSNRSEPLATVLNCPRGLLHLSGSSC